MSRPYRSGPTPTTTSVVASPSSSSSSGRARLRARSSRIIRVRSSNIVAPLLVGVALGDEQLPLDGRELEEPAGRQAVALRHGLVPLPRGDGLGDVVDRL